MSESAGRMIFCDGQLLVRAGGVEPAGDGRTMEALKETRRIMDEFVVKPQGFAAAEVSGGTDEAPAGCGWARIRALLVAEAPRAGEACRALGLLNWRSARRFCGACGGAMGEHETEIARKCGRCERVEYPAVAPAVIVRIEKEGKILLAQHVQRVQHWYTCLAGYVELGETLEEAVRREVREEAGIEVDEVRYVSSQPWPFPNQLMLGFAAKWKSGELKLQAEELSDARWFDPEDLPEIPPPGSLAYRLIRGSGK